MQQSLSTPRGPASPTTRRPSHADPAAARPPLTLAGVSYLNAKPLLDGLDADPGVRLRLGVPSELRGVLEVGEADAALLPVFDLFDSPQPLRMLDAGGIGCDGPTLTVRLLSRRPIERVRRVMLDSDSHTSVALLKVLLRWRGVEPVCLPWSPRGGGGAGGEARGAGLPSAEQADAVLLIGDKVVTSRRGGEAFPHELDLGEAWKRATGLPFVFAAWTARSDADRARLAGVLRGARERGVARAHRLAEAYAEGHGWPTDLARRYLGEVLRYEIGPRQVEAIRRFGRACFEMGLSASDGAARLPETGGADD